MTQENPSPVSVPQTKSEFPNGDTVRGKVYQLANPLNSFQQIAVMGIDTYTDTGTLIQSLRGVCSDQDKRIKELLEENKVLNARLAEALNRLDNLRAVRRSELRPEIEQQLLDLPAEYRQEG
jgi:hypothetical protein